MTASLFAAGDGRGGVEDLMAEPTATTPSYASTTSLYRKYRPRSFDDQELVGQEHVVRTLRNAIALDRVAHAYLFSGPRGTGKTTTARLLAKAVNCLDPDPASRPCNRCASCLSINAGASPDIIEIDAASNRGIDDIRDLRERTRFAPAQLRSKVYIIDEAHQITGAAANAFLKTLEEPPAHSRFILATTDPEQLLPTIVSRCQQFEFRKVSADDMARRLRSVANLEGIRVTDAALQLVARSATGSLRDGLGLLEQMALRAAAPANDASSGTDEIDVTDVQAALGLSSSDRVEGLLEAIARRQPANALRIVHDAEDHGEDPRQLNRQLLGYLRVLLLERSGGNPEVGERTRELARLFPLGELAALARRFSEIDFAIRHAPLPLLPLEVAIVESCADDSQPERPRSGERSQDVAQSAMPPPRPSPLRDRVRNVSASGETGRPLAPSSHHQEPAPITPIRPSVSASSDAARSGDDPPALDVEQIAELWPNVRADVKALNRRIEALLSEVDPVAISGNLITLAVPYPFHRDKLNSDEVRETVAGALSRRLNREISLVCILRGEISAMASPQSLGTSPQEAPHVADALPSDHDERSMSRLRAAKNIFDAEEIDGS